ncbi:MAG: META domain-containing protein [Woeseiaceae bacterium]
MTRITFVATLLCVLLIGGCAKSDSEAETTQVDASNSDLSLMGSNWQVNLIDEQDLVENSKVTLFFAEDSKVAGSAGCNRYFGSVTIAGGAISFGNAGATMMACPEPLMSQEQRYLAALNGVSRGEINAAGELLLFDETSNERIRAVAYVSAPEVAVASSPQPLDQAAIEGFAFDCGAAGTADVRFVGPDTIELIFADKIYILSLQRAASGAKYSTDDVTFWNKGDEALIEISEQGHRCIRIKAGDK